MVYIRDFVPQCIIKAVHLMSLFVSAMCVAFSPNLWLLTKTSAMVGAEQSEGTNWTVNFQFTLSDGAATYITDKIWRYL